MQRNDACSCASEWLEHLSGQDAEDLRELMGSPSELEDSFSGELRFGTGGLRGKIGIGPNRLNIYTVGKATQGLADFLNGSSSSGMRPKVAICRDSRHGSDDFARRAAEVLAANGIDVVLFPRVEPTPLLSFAVRQLGCSAGVCITASHNPAVYNGYKVYGSDGGQITVGLAKAILESMDAVDMFSGVRVVPFDEARESGRIAWISDEVVDAYCAAVFNQSLGVSCEGIRAVYTPLNGTGLECARRVLSSVGLADLVVVDEQAEPNGDFPTCPIPNPEEPEALALALSLAEESDADLVLATDPDADRVGVAAVHDGEWHLLNGNQIGVLLLEFLAEREHEEGHDLSRRVACSTIVTTPMADDIALAYGFELRRTLTGFKFIGEQIGLLEQEGRESDFLFGMEESYGYLLGTYVRDKDGILACMLVAQLAAALKKRGSDLWEWMHVLQERYGYWSGKQVSKAFEGAGGQSEMRDTLRCLKESIPDSIGGLDVERVVDYSKGVPMPVIGGRGTDQELPASDVLEWRLAGGSKIVIRPSGTEPKLKTYLFVRSENAQDADALMLRLSSDLEAMLRLS